MEYATYGHSQTHIVLWNLEPLASIDSALKWVEYILGRCVSEYRMLSYRFDQDMFAAFRILHSYCCCVLNWETLA